MFQQKMRAKREQLAKVAKEKGRGGNFNHTNRIYTNVACRDSAG